jgi:hypothetical protein
VGRTPVRLSSLPTPLPHPPAPIPHNERHSRSTPHPRPRAYPVHKSSPNSAKIANFRTICRFSAKLGSSRRRVTQGRGDPAGIFWDITQSEKEPHKKATKAKRRRECHRQTKNFKNSKIQFINEQFFHIPSTLLIPTIFVGAFRSFCAREHPDPHVFGWNYHLFTRLVCIPLFLGTHHNSHGTHKPKQIHKPFNPYSLVYSS